MGDDKKIDDQTFLKNRFIIRTVSILAAMAVLFYIGSSIWKVQNQGFFRALLLPDNYGDEVSQLSRFRGNANEYIIEVGDTQVSNQDLEWEIQLIKNQIKVEQFGMTNGNELSPTLEEALEKSLLPMIVERKVLYGYLLQDETFAIDKPERYLSCISDWQKVEALSVNSPSRFRDSKFVKEALCEKSLLQQYLKEVIDPRIVITENEINAHYQDNLKYFTKRDIVEIRHILIGDEAVAQKVRAMINPKNFVNLAKKYSIAPEGSEGGALPPYSKGGLIPVFDRAFSMQPQQISDVIRSDYGYHIMMLERRVSHGSKNKDEVTEEIRDILFRQKRAAEYQKWMERALAKLPVAGVRSLKYIW